MTNTLKVASVKLANLIENHTASDTVMTPCMHTTYESYNNIAKTIQPGGGSRGGGLRVARQYGRENIQEYVQGVYNSLLACSPISYVDSHLQIVF